LHSRAVKKVNYSAFNKEIAVHDSYNYQSEESLSAQVFFQMDRTATGSLHGLRQLAG